MKKMLLFVTLLMGVLWIVPSAASAQDVYFTSALSYDGNKRCRADFYYDDETLSGSKEEGKIAVMMKAVRQDNGKLIDKSFFGFMYQKGAWYLYDKVDDKFYPLAQFDDSSPIKILFDILD